MCVESGRLRYALGLVLVRLKPQLKGCLLVVSCHDDMCMQGLPPFTPKRDVGVVGLL